MTETKTNDEFLTNNVAQVPFGTENIIVDAKFARGRTVTMNGKQVYVMEMPKSKWYTCLPDEYVHHVGNSLIHLSLPQNKKYNLIRRVWDDQKRKLVRERTVAVDTSYMLRIFQDAPRYQGKDLVESDIIWQTPEELGLVDEFDQPYNADDEQYF